MDDRLERFIRTKLRGVGRRVEETRAAYRAGQAEVWGLPTDGEGRARIVCRRYAERRQVNVNGKGRPECFDEDHPDCRGCAEDVREGVVETW